MSKHYLHPLFSPTSIAVFGATNDEQTLGYTLFKNLLDSSYNGKIYPINSDETEVLGQAAYKKVKDVEQKVDLAIIAAPAKTVPHIINECGEAGIKVAVLASSGFSDAGASGKKLEKAVKNNAKRYGIRFVGPNCLGLTRPKIGLNLFNTQVKPGKLALISQSLVSPSEALGTALLDWANSNDVGFSAVLSIGLSADVDFGEILDYLVTDTQTRGILVYMESVYNTRSLMSGLRAAARVKPVIVIKSGRHSETSQLTMARSGKVMGHDGAFDAALQRAGAVRVYNFEQLFTAATILAAYYQTPGNHLAIISNGGAPGIIAADHMIDCVDKNGFDIQMAKLSRSSIDKLNKILPPTWSKTNPIDILTDANTERYTASLALCLEDPNVDAVLVILSPQPHSEPLETARAVIEAAKKSPKPILACWMGGAKVEEAEQLFVQAHLPEFHTPEAAVEAFSYLAAHHKNQQLLMQTPAASTNNHSQPPDLDGARIIIENVLSERRKVLTDMESKALLGAFRIPINYTAIARSVNEAIVTAQSMGFPVALKIYSRDITRKSEVGGVRLNVRNAAMLRDVYKNLMEEVTNQCPDANIEGITVEPMVNKPHGRELVVGIVRDPIFGPVITFGMGGSLVEIIGDKAVGLPPLNRYLVDCLVDRTHAARILEEFRRMPAAKREALDEVLLHVSEMACELPWLQEMEINPLIIDEHNAVVVDARITVNYYIPKVDRYAHMAIYPYPTHLVSDWQLPDGTHITIRPIRPEDAQMEQAFVRSLSAESKYFRFMQSIDELTPDMLVRFTQIDYDREMALIAVTSNKGADEQLGVARYSINPDGETCEFAIVVSDKWRHYGIAHKLMNCLIDAARARGLKLIVGEVLSNNHNMLKFMEKLGFSAMREEDDLSLTLVSRSL